MAYLDHTSPEVVELLFAVGKIGVVIVPMNWRLAAPELLAVLTDYCAQVLIAGGVLDIATELDERKAPPAELIVVGDTGPHGYENWRSTEARQFHAVVVPSLEQRPSGGCCLAFNAVAGSLGHRVALGQATRLCGSLAKVAGSYVCPVPRLEEAGHHDVRDGGAPAEAWRLRALSPRMGARLARALARGDDEDLDRAQRG
jgi:AMP-binding enzyme